MENFSGYRLSSVAKRTSANSVVLNSPTAQAIAKKTNAFFLDVQQNPERDPLNLLSIPKLLDELCPTVRAMEEEKSESSKRRPLP